MKTDTPPQRRLNCSELAAAIGPRRGGRPTDPETVRGWMIQGLSGVRLASELEGGIRMTTWADYEAFKVAIAAEKERQRAERAERRDHRPAALRRRARAAKRELERMGAR